MYLNIFGDENNYVLIDLQTSMPIHPLTSNVYINFEKY